MPRRRTSRLQGCRRSACQIWEDAIGPHIKTARTSWVRMSNLGGRHGSAAENVMRPLARPLTAILSSLSIPISVRRRSADAFEVSLKESACEIGLFAVSAPVQPANARSGWPATSARMWKTAPAPGSSAVWRDVVMKTSRRSSPPRVTAVTPRTGSSHSPSTSASGE